MPNEHALSILICHLPERTETFNRLMGQLKHQLLRRDPEDVEIIVEATPRGEMTTGEKRNKLLDQATGEYIAFIDDDDMISDDYVKRILAATEEGKDCIGMVGVLKRLGWPDWEFRHSITVDRWCKDDMRKIYFRTPNHLNPVKRELALQVKFKNITIGEDRDYSDRIKPLLLTETFLEDPIYYYLK